MPACPGTAPSSAATASSPRCELLWVAPEIAKGVLRTLAATQATEIDRGRRRRSPARSSTRCAAARWRGSARCRSAAITARSTRRRCSSCSPASISSAPATSRRSARSGRTSRRRSTGSTTYGDPDGDGFVEYARMTERGLANQGWKDSFDSHLPRRRQRRRGADRAVRGAGLCLRRQAGRGARSRARWARRARGRA